MTVPAVSVVIVNAGVYNLLADCLTSIPDAVGEPYEVIVVDNQVRLDELTALKRQFGHEVTWMPMKHNIGFAAGNNVGAAEAKAGHILLLNPDTLLPPGSVQQLVSTMAQFPQVGIMGCRLLNGDGSDQTSAYGLEPSLGAMWLDGVGLQFAWRALTRIAGRIRRQPEVRRAAWAKGACLLVTAELWRSLRGFDEAFFMFGEDADLCRRARDAGYDIAWAPRIAITHLGGRSYAAGGIRDQGIRDYYSSYERYVIKHQGVGPWRLRVRLLRIGMRSAALTRCVALTVVSPGNSSRRAAARAYWRYVRSPHQPGAVPFPPPGQAHQA